MTDLTDRLQGITAPQSDVGDEVELEYSRRLERDIAAVAKQFYRCKTQPEIDTLWDHLKLMIYSRTPRQIHRMEMAMGLSK